MTDSPITAIELHHVALPTRREHKWTGLTEPIGGYVLVKMIDAAGNAGWGEAPALLSASEKMWARAFTALGSLALVAVLVAGLDTTGIVAVPPALAIAARYVFAPSIFDALDRTPPGKGGEIQLTDAIRRLIDVGQPVLGMRLRPGERRFDIGNIDAYFRAFVEFALADDRHGPALRTFVRGLIDADHP